MAVFVLRESARERSPYMPYLQTMQMHDVSGVPMLWPVGAPQWKSVSPMQIELGRTAKANQQKQYDTVMRPMLMRHRAVLSEGLGCSGLVGCSASRLDSVYSPAEFARVLAIISARDWVLPMYGNERPFMAPVLDMLNFGQVGIRADFSSKAGAFIAKATQPIEVGTELLFWYGNMCYEKWINMYGFAPAGHSTPCSNRKKTMRNRSLARSHLARATGR